MSYIWVIPAHQIKNFISYIWVLSRPLNQYSHVVHLGHPRSPNQKFHIVHLGPLPPTKPILPCRTFGSSPLTKSIISYRTFGSSPTWPPLHDIYIHYMSYAMTCIQGCIVATMSWTTVVISNMDSSGMSGAHPCSLFVLFGCTHRLEKQQRIVWWTENVMIEMYRA